MLMVAMLVIPMSGYFACVSDVGPKKGSEGGPCYGDQTCDGELKCVKDLCTRADGGTSDAGADSGGPGDGGPDVGTDGSGTCGPIPSSPCGCTGQKSDCCLSLDAGERCSNFDPCPNPSNRYVECSSDDDCGNRACCFKGDPIPAACGTLASGAMDSRCQLVDSGEVGKPGCFIGCVTDLHCAKYDAGKCRPFYLGDTKELYGACAP
jgi:hypothetical protein